MKRIKYVGIILIAVIALALTSCGTQPSSAKKAEQVVGTCDSCGKNAPLYKMTGTTVKGEPHMCKICGDELVDKVDDMKLSMDINEVSKWTIKMEPYMSE